MTSSTSLGTTLLQSLSRLKDINILAWLLTILRRHIGKNIVSQKIQIINIIIKNHLETIRKVNNKISNEKNKLKIIKKK